ncbi:MAG TPA: hypothetical protein PKU74_10375, partial [Candidatus Omnitrophota bacterium]|nr:hypothetical protein [Candidatus Omnitrophota bacterium]
SWRHAGPDRPHPPPPPPPPRGPKYQTSIYAELTLDNFEFDWEIDPGEFRFGIPEGTTLVSEEDFKKQFE